MTKQVIKVLFCDNEEDNHNLFDQKVLPFLKEQFGDFDIQVDHSRSLEPGYEPKYSLPQLKNGWRSVKSLMDGGWVGDLVISDVDFEKVCVMGDGQTGLEILERISRESSRFHWCHAILMTHYADEQRHDFHFDAGSVMKKGWCLFVDMSATVPEKNWQTLGEIATEQIKDALAVREKLRDAPDLFRFRIFRSTSEGAACLTVWDKDEDKCLEAHIFEGIDADILMVLHRRRRRLMDMHSLTRELKKEGRTRQGAQGSRTENNLRTRIKRIRDAFDGTHLGSETSELRRAGKVHSGPHQTGRVCGYCVVFNPEHGGAGYSLAGESFVVDLPETIPTEGVLANPAATWQLLTGSSKKAEKTA